MQSVEFASIVSIAAQMHARQHGFLAAAALQRLDLAHNLRQRAADARAARNGGDAECAGVVAAVLHLDKCARAPGEPRRHGALKRLAVVDFNGLPGNLRDQLVFVAIANDALHARQRGNLMRGNLGIAARDRRLAGWIGALIIANQLAAGLGRFLRYRAGIQHEVLGIGGRIDDFVAQLAKLPRHRVNFALIQAAAHHAQVYFHKRASWLASPGA